MAYNNQFFLNPDCIKNPPQITILRDHQIGFQTNLLFETCLLSTNVLRFPQFFSNHKILPGQFLIHPLLLSIYGILFISSVIFKINEAYNLSLPLKSTPGIELSLRIFFYSQQNRFTILQKHKNPFYVNQDHYIKMNVTMFAIHFPLKILRLTNEFENLIKIHYEIILGHLCMVKSFNGM